jgi:hypothetical protein
MTVSVPVESGSGNGSDETESLSYLNPSLTTTLTQNVTACDQENCTEIPMTITTVVPTNAASTTIQTVIEGYTVTVVVPCDSVASEGATEAVTPVSTVTVSESRATGTVSEPSVQSLVQPYAPRSGYQSSDDAFTHSVPAHFSSESSKLAQPSQATVTVATSGSAASSVVSGPPVASDSVASNSPAASAPGSDSPPSAVSQHGTQKVESQTPTLSFTQSPSQTRVPPPNQANSASSTKIAASLLLLPLLAFI